MTEQELAAHVVAWLQAQHYEVYQEVQVASYGSVADIVVDVNGRGWVIETKTSFGLAVLGQADRWRHYATRVSVATPGRKRRPDGSVPSITAAEEMGWRICKRFGIGWLRVNSRGQMEERVSPRFERLQPRYKRRKDDILASCHAGHQSGALAGAAGGGHWTPYSNTMQGVREYLRQRADWVPLKELIDGIAHHYSTSSTARSCVSRMLQTVEARKGWVECRTNGRRLEFRLKESPDSP